MARNQKGGRSRGHGKKWANDSFEEMFGFVNGVTTPEKADARKPKKFGLASAGFRPNESAYSNGRVRFYEPASASAAASRHSNQLSTNHHSLKLPPSASKGQPLYKHHSRQRFKATNGATPRSSAPLFLKKPGIEEPKHGLELHQNTQHCSNSKGAPYPHGYGTAIVPGASLSKNCSDYDALRNKIEKEEEKLGEPREKLSQIFDGTNGERNSGSGNCSTSSSSVSIMWPSSQAGSSDQGRHNKRPRSSGQSGRESVGLAIANRKSASQGIQHIGRRPVKCQPPRDGDHFNLSSKGSSQDQRGRQQRQSVEGLQMVQAKREGDDDPDYSPHKERPGKRRRESDQRGKSAEQALEILDESDDEEEDDEDVGYNEDVLGTNAQKALNDPARTGTEPSVVIAMEEGLETWKVEQPQPSPSKQRLVAGHLVVGAHTVCIGRRVYGRKRGRDDVKAPASSAYTLKFVPVFGKLTLNGGDLAEARIEKADLTSLRWHEKNGQWAVIITTTGTCEMASKYKDVYAPASSEKGKGGRLEDSLQSGKRYIVVLVDGADGGNAMKGIWDERIRGGGEALQYLAEKCPDGDVTAEEVGYFYRSLELEEEEQQQKEKNAIEEEKRKQEATMLDEVEVAEAPSRTRTRRSHRLARKGLGSGDEDVLFSYPSGRHATDPIFITAADMLRTEQGEFLNDNLVDLYLKYLALEKFAQVTSPDGGEKPKLVHIFSSHFFTKLREKAPVRHDGDFAEAYMSVQRWTRTIDLFAFKFIIVPIVEDMHWSVAILCNLGQLAKRLAQAGTESSDVIDVDDDDGNVDVFVHEGDGSHADDEGSSDSGGGRAMRKSSAGPLTPCIVFLDSLQAHKSGRIGNFLRKYIAMEWQQRKGSAIGGGGLGNGKSAASKIKFIELSKEDLPLVKPNAPTQINGCDCGVYVLEYCECMYEQWPLVTSRDVKVKLSAVFTEDTFSPEDIRQKRDSLKKLLRELQAKDKEYREVEKNAKEARRRSKAIEKAQRGAGGKNGRGGGQKEENKGPGTGAEKAQTNKEVGKEETAEGTKSVRKEDDDALKDDGANDNDGDDDDSSCDDDDASTNDGDNETASIEIVEPEGGSTTSRGAKKQTPEEQVKEKGGGDIDTGSITKKKKRADDVGEDFSDCGSNMSVHAIEGNNDVVQRRESALGFSSTCGRKSTYGRRNRQSNEGMENAFSRSMGLHAGTSGDDGGVKTNVEHEHDDAGYHDGGDGNDIREGSQVCTSREKTKADEQNGTVKKLQKSVFALLHQGMDELGKGVAEAGLRKPNGSDDDAECTGSGANMGEVQTSSAEEEDVRAGTKDEEKASAEKEMDSELEGAATEEDEVGGTLIDEGYEEGMMAGVVGDASEVGDDDEQSRHNQVEDTAGKKPLFWADKRGHDRERDALGALVYGGARSAKQRQCS